MTIFEKAITSIKRQPVKNITLIVLIFILGTATLGAISVRAAIIATEENMMMRVPTVSTIQVDAASAALELGVSIHDPHIWNENRPTSDDIAAVGQLPYVRAYDFYFFWTFMSSDFEWFVPEVDESRISREILELLSLQLSGDHYLFDNETERFPVRAVNHPELTDIESGLLSLASGRTFYPEEIENGTMVAAVSQGFADLNNLYLGAAMPFHLVLHDDLAAQNEGIRFGHHWLDERFMLHYELLEFEVIGIYNVEFEFNYENYQAPGTWMPLDQFANLHNQIYIPISVLDPLLLPLHESYREMRARQRESGIYINEDPEPFIHAFFLLYDPRDLRIFSESAEDLLPDFWGVADVSGTFAPIISSMDIILEIADLILVLAIGATVMTMTLVTTFLLRERKREIGVYIALGEKKYRILIQFLIEIGILVATGVILSLFLGSTLSTRLSRNMFEQILAEQMIESHLLERIPSELELFNPGIIPLEEMLEMYDTSLDRQAIVIFIGVTSIIVLFSTALPIMQIIKINPKKILSD
ncbi:MAG: ABC transporter permease [Turicibacter sp.]|nr:ABC transporter permease [Turicibacter sp.]